MKILLTAFDPFGGDKVNPAQEAVKALNPAQVGCTVVKVEVPTVFGKAITVAAQAIRQEQPDVVVCIGQAGGRFAITPERVAINLDDARIADNEGNQPLDQPIVPAGPAAYFSNLPLKAMVQAMQDGGIPAQLSSTAGTFVCNHLMYGVLHTVASEFPQIRAGFIHVPFIPAQVINRPNTPALALADITTGLELALKAILSHSEDLKLRGGSEC